jgi:protein required for attachment to host cells
MEWKGTAMPKKRTTWFCVADAGHVRIKDATTRTAPLPTVTTLRHEVYEHGQVEPAPRVQESASPARHAIADAESPIRREKRGFAETVADYLNEGAKRGAYERLVVAAPPKFLGDLRAALDAKARERIVGEIAKDLTKEADAELLERLDEAAAAR